MKEVGRKWFIFFLLWLTLSKYLVCICWNVKTWRQSQPQAAFKLTGDKKRVRKETCDRKDIQTQPSITNSVCKTCITSAKTVAIAVVEGLKSAVATAQDGVGSGQRSCRQKRKQSIRSLWASRAGHVPLKQLLALQIYFRDNKGTKEKELLLSKQKELAIRKMYFCTPPLVDRDFLEVSQSQSLLKTVAMPLPPHLRRGLYQSNISYNYSQAWSLSIHLPI